MDIFTTSAKTRIFKKNPLEELNSKVNTSDPKQMKEFVEAQLEHMRKVLESRTLGFKVRSYVFVHQ